MSFASAVAPASIGPSGSHGTSHGAWDALGRLTAILWWGAVVAGAALLLLGPGTAVWAAAQTGGPLEPILSEGLGGAVRPRPPGYWWAVTWLVGGVTGAWWIGASGLLALGRTPVRRLLGIAAPLLPRRGPWVLAGAGVLLLVSSVIGAQLS